MKYKDPDYMKKWRAANKEHLKAERRKWYETHRTVEIANARKWIVDNHERFLILRKVIAANQRYPERITIADVDAVLERAGRVCCWCGKKNLKGRDLTLEHLRPFNRRDCLAIACRTCNSARITRFGPRKTDDQRRLAKRELNRLARERNKRGLSESRQAR
jgi:hypothetical protein